MGLRPPAMMKLREMRKGGRSEEVGGDLVEPFSFYAQRVPGALIWDMSGSARIFFGAGLSVGPVHALDPRNWRRLTTFYVLLLFEQRQSKQHSNSHIDKAQGT